MLPHVTSLAPFTEEKDVHVGPLGSFAPAVTGLLFG